MIVIIDYQMGNIKNVHHALTYLGYRVKVSDEPEVIRKAQGVILPGVGAFRDAIKILSEKRLDRSIREVIQQGIPFLGICLGMQLLFSCSEENGFYQGLGLIPGKVVRFSPSLRVPHLGWNQAQVCLTGKGKEKSLFSGIANNSYFYFLHSYYCIPQQEKVIASHTDYQHSFASCVHSGNVMGVQFHPEKSSRQGLKLLKNFGEMCFEDYSGN